MKRKKQIEEKGKKKKGSSFSTFLLVILFLAGMGIMLYPTVSDWWNSMHASRAIASYVEAVGSMTQEEKDAILEAARAYNEALPAGVHFLLSDEEYAEYESLLDLNGSGIMGYINIPAIGVNMPLYHSTDESVLQIAIGHIPGSSLPVGGEKSHCVVSGHRGLPSARLFTDLDQIVEGDTFMVTVLDQVLTYQVDQIRIVLPEETDELAIVEGEDYFTMVTCTPYGINSHRLLVRGRRIENAADSGLIIVKEATKFPATIVMLAVGIPLLFILLLILLIYYSLKRPKKDADKMLEELRRK